MSKHIILRVCAAVWLLAIILATLPQRALALDNDDVSYPADQAVASGAAVSISASVNSNVAISYLWQRTDTSGLAPSNIAGVFSNTLSFTAPVLAPNSPTQTISFRLDVLGGQNTVSRYVSIFITAPPNTAPSANAGAAQTVFSGDDVFLAGEALDADIGDGIRFAWTTPADIRIADADTLRPYFTAPHLDQGADSILVPVTLTVTDSVGATASSTVQITIVPRPALANLIVDIGPDLSAASGARVLLSAEIIGAEASVHSYAWSATLGSFEDSTSAQATFLAPVVDAPTEVTITLTVTETISGHDPRGGVGTVSLTIGQTIPTPQTTNTSFANFTNMRINNLIALQPDLLSIIGGGDGGANLTVSSMGGQVDLSTAPDKNVWARLKGNWSTVDGSKSDYILGSAGTHTTLANGVILGAMAQVDRMESKEGDATLTGTGFLVGPYVVAKLPDQPISIQGRLLYGKSSNEYAPLGTFVDRFDSTRLMAQLGVSGQIINGTTVWKPNLQAAYASEQTEAYTDGAGTDIAGTKTTIGQVAAGLDVTFALPAPTGGLTATLGLTNIWTNGLGGGSAAFEGHRAKISAGINRAFAAGTSLSLTTSYDGLGANSYESIGLDLLFQHRF